jgi:ABC-type lipoprotein export system ATPase subunit
VTAAGAALPGGSSPSQAALRPAVISAHDVFCLHPTPRGHVAALRGLTLQVSAGERVVVHGPNGSGKTTLLRVLSGVQPPSAGTVVVAGVDLVDAEDATRAALRSSGLGLIDQHHAASLRPELDVLDNVALQLRVAGYPTASARDRARLALGALDLDHLAGRRPVDLSGGEAQRVAVCAALAHGPSLVLADEPTGELDRASAEAVYDVLVRATAAVGAALVLVSHDLAAARVADRVVRIRDGRLSEEWVPGREGAETLVIDDRGWLRLPEPLRRSTGLTNGVLAEERNSEGVPAIVLLRGPRASAPAQPPPAPVAGAQYGDPGGMQQAHEAVTGLLPVAVVAGVGVTRGSRPVLEGVDLQVRRGRLVVVQGRSGSGKSTLLRVLTGLERPDTGSVRVGDVDLAGLGRAGLARLRREHVAIAGQGGALVEALDVEGNLHLARDARGLGADESVVDGWLERMGLSALRHRPARTLSGGERQRVAVTCALVSDRPLVVLDEPTSSQDEAGAERLVAVLVQAAARGLSLVVATHDPVVVGAADEVLTLG